MKDIFITSPIYYVNDIPHIGHAYTTIACDAFKKYQILKGNNAILLTGTDEHGQKIENSAKAKGKSAQEYADEISAKFRNLWDYFGIDYDYFVRTTDDYHDDGVKCAFEIMQKKGDIYKGQYEGNYCVSCETFFTKRQLIDGEKCPDCGKLTKEIKEESYFFALSKYEKRLLDWYAQNEEVILPKFKRNEVIKFVENGLSDLSITRSTFSWGISLPKSANDTTHIIYVWLDALLSYITPLGFGNTRDCGDSARDSRTNKMPLFENAYHFVGKDILRFHAIFWPAFLMSLDLPLPKRIFTHGWWLIEGAKMSKSVGNVVNPKDIADTYGLEILRYFLLREVPFGQDGDFAIRALIERANAELSDSLGNLLNRILGMSEKYFALNIQSSDFSAFKDERQIAESTLGGLDSLMESMATNRYLEEVWKLFDLANGMVTKYAPWELIKQNRRDEAQSVLVFIANLLAKGAVAIYPILPKSAEAIMRSLGANMDYDLIAKNAMITKFSLIKIPPLFPKFEVDSKELQTQSAKNSPSLRDSAQSVESKQSTLPQIKIDDFRRIDIRVGEILEANRVEGSEKLLVFQIDFGDFGKRQIVSGIAQFYAPKELIGKKICAIINLKPTKIMGVKSYGMLLTAVEQIAESSKKSTLDSANGAKSAESSKPAESSEKVALLFTDSAIGSQVC